jgi:hypothetical protein
MLNTSLLLVRVVGVALQAVEVVPVDIEVVRNKVT